MAKFVQWVVALGVSAFAIWILAASVDGHAFVSALKNADLRWLVATACTATLYHLFRSLRWGVLAESQVRLSLRDILSINGIGYLAINLLPFRTGEIIRPALLTSRSDVPLATGVALSVVDRLIDILTLGFLFALVLVAAPIPVEVLEIGGTEVDLAHDGRKVVVGAMVLFGAVALVPVLMGARGEALVRRFAGARVAQMYLGFVRGVRSLGSVTILTRAFGWNLVAWVANVASLWTLGRAFGMDGFDAWAALISQVLLIIGVMLPAPPAFAGVFEAFATAGPVLHGISPSVGAAWAVTLHGIQLGILLVVGCFFLWWDDIGVGDVLRMRGRSQ